MSESSRSARALTSSGAELVAVAAGVSILVACSRSPVLVHGPIDVHRSPSRAALVHPARADVPGWELCFDFERADDSRSAKTIDATLIAASGRGYRLVDASLDRRGEAIVCQVGHLAEQDSRARNGRWSTVVVEALELSVQSPVRIRSVRGGPWP